MNEENKKSESVIEELVPSRKVISDKICELITKGKSYRLGISGNWGSGKSTIAQNIVKDNKKVLYVDVWEYQYIDNIEDMIFLAILKNEGINLSNQKKILDFMKEGKSTLITLAFKGAKVFTGLENYVDAASAVKDIIKLAGRNNESAQEKLYKKLMSSSEIVKDMMSQNEYSCIIFDELDRVTYDVVVKVIQYCQFFNTYYTGVNASTLIIYNNVSLQGMLKYAYGEDFDFEAYSDKIFTHNVFELDTYVDSIEKILEKKKFHLYTKEICSMFEVCKSSQFNIRELIDCISELNEFIINNPDMELTDHEHKNLTKKGKTILFFVMLVRSKSFGIKSYNLNETIEILTKLNNLMSNIEEKIKEYTLVQLGLLNHMPINKMREGGYSLDEEMNYLYLDYIEKIKLELDNLFPTNGWELENNSVSKRFKDDLKDLYNFLHKVIYVNGSKLEQSRNYEPDSDFDLEDEVKACNKIVVQLIEVFSIMK